MHHAYHNNPHHHPHPHPHEPHGPEWIDERRAENCDDQLPNISRVGRGLEGNSYRVKISDPDTETETYLEGEYVDAHSGEVISDWVSENINGGKLSYQYNLNPFTDPATFTMTFSYRRPGRTEWTWTTPAIPFQWSIDGDGNKKSGDGIVGSGVATLFVKHTNKPWKEMLIYPDGTTREDFNAPEQGEPWTVNLDLVEMELVDFDALAKVIGISKGDIINIINDKGFTIDGTKYPNLKAYIDAHDKKLQDNIDDLEKHIHEDMGFGDGLVNDGNKLGNAKNTIKKYIDSSIGDLTNIINKLKASIPASPEPMHIAPILRLYQVAHNGNDDPKGGEGPEGGEHLMTTSFYEYCNVLRNIPWWQGEGVPYWVMVPGEIKKPYNTKLILQWTDVAHRGLKIYASTKVDWEGRLVATKAIPAAHGLRAYEGDILLERGGKALGLSADQTYIVLSCEPLYTGLQYSKKTNPPSSEYTFSGPSGKEIWNGGI